MKYFLRQTSRYITLIQIKLFLVLSAGYLLFEEELNLNQFFGLSLTVFGSFVYSYLKVYKHKKIPKKN